MSATPVPAWMQVEVLMRDNWTCLACGRRVHRYPDGKVRDDTASIDHIVPDTAQHRGLTVPDNLQTLCRQCNARKGSRIRDYRPRSEGDDGSAASRDAWPFKDPDPSWLQEEPRSGYWETLPAKYLGHESGWIGVLWVESAWWVTVFDRDEWLTAPVLLEGPFDDFDAADQAHLDARAFARDLEERFRAEEDIDWRRAVEEDNAERRRAAWDYYYDTYGRQGQVHQPGIFLTGIRGRCFTGRLCYSRPDDAPLRPELPRR